MVDDDPAFGESVTEALSALGWRSRYVGVSGEAAALVRDLEYDALVTDLRMPDVDGLALLSLAKEVAPERPVIVMTAFSAIDSAVECVRQGAYHYLTKPFKVRELDLYLQRALEERALRRTARELRRALHERYALGGLVAGSAVMSDVFDLITRVADSTLPLVIIGETGVGKTMVAHVIHAESERSEGPFVSVNCAALPDPLLESELFGHVRGAFTGATTNREGLFADAHGGTLFLDEIGDMKPELQAKLLYVLESGRVRAVGTSSERKVDVRIVAATHRDLRELVAQGSFRQDLLYRLEGAVIEVPPLRQRGEDVLALANHFLKEARAAQPRARAERLAPETAQVLIEYSWPGNVRELEHAMRRAVLLSQEAEVQPSDLPDALSRRPPKAMIDFGTTVLPVREMQRRYARWALDQMGGRKMLACERLGIDSKTLAKWLAPDGETS